MSAVSLRPRHAAAEFALKIDIFTRAMTTTVIPTGETMVYPKAKLLVYGVTVRVSYH
jgi:hypothetical protein